MMSLDRSFVRLLFLLSFQCVFGRERGVNVDRKAKSSLVFNVKSFGAKADGQSDDTKVRSQFFLLYPYFIEPFLVLKLDGWLLYT